ncbi:NUDIX hydrolase [Jeotgalibacillus sp. R-1-5s-1]|uniref:NUDIX hydrolase n=1 Tax=Jeotgalibacillus sp. R-1-5s-1 TaxID=2555897 RepID=UPI00106AFF0E|nr:NUDIX domain-containing protein [Jeotgalibacillus sp. R-1-5s-1]TFD93625.1 NUDIX domain-containing protein [Jeotgalibacillus sp. R-1-5s-1]
MITFGEKESGIDYVLRPAVYVLIFNNKRDKIAIIRKRDGKYFLPGGGIENRETHEECLKREALEELGFQVEISTFIGSARRYFYSVNEGIHYLNEGHFYFCSKIKEVIKPTEDDYELIWLEPDHAIDCLIHDHQKWAVKEALRR